MDNNPNFDITFKPYVLINQIQYYEWGTRGEQAFIPNLIGMPVEVDRPYAELWMGTHPSAPSQINISGNLIGMNEIIKKSPIELLGKTVFERFGSNLPFLFKILSVAQVLSIQAHPNLTQALHLHQSDPTHYPDQNHKPEIAIALDELTAFVGLLNPLELNKRFALYPEVQRFVGNTLTIDRNSSKKNNVSVVRRFYSGLIQRANAEPRLYGHLIKSLEVDIFRRGNQISEQERVFLELIKHYPLSDIGLIMSLFMNLMHLHKGQAFLIAAGVPHAYISGNIIECMTNSDNVVRLGLTKKFKDIPALLDILDYSVHSVEIINPEPRNGIITYQTPVEEFFIMNIRLESDSEKDLNTNGKVQIGLVLDGQIEIIWNHKEKSSFNQGESVLIPACVNKYTLRSQNPAEIFLATVN